MDWASWPTWDWKIKSYTKDGKFVMETVHKGEESKNIELRAIETLGQTAELFDLRPKKYAN